LSYCDIFDLHSYGNTNAQNRKLYHRELDSRLQSIVFQYVPTATPNNAFWSMLEDTGASIIGSTARHILFPFSSSGPLHIGTPDSTYDVVRTFLLFHGAKEVSPPVTTSDNSHPTATQPAPDIPSQDAWFTYDFDHDHEPDADQHTGVSEVCWFEIGVS
jgi:hypothetical protein